MCSNTFPRLESKAIGRKSDNSTLAFIIFIGIILTSFHSVGKPLDDVVRDAIYATRFFIINIFNYVSNSCRVCEMVSIWIWECSESVVEVINMIWNCSYTTWGSGVKIILWHHRSCTAENWGLKGSKFICYSCGICYIIIIMSYLSTRRGFSSSCKLINLHKYR